MKTVDITPSWQTIVSMCLEVIQNPNADQEAKQNCRDELMRLAKAMDDHLASVKKYNETVTTLGDIVEEELSKGRII